MKGMPTRRWHRQALVVVLAGLLLGVGGNATAASVVPAGRDGSATRRASVGGGGKAAKPGESTGKRSRAKAAGRKPSKGAKKRARRPVVELYHVNRRNKMFLRLVDQDGTPRRSVHQQARWFFRCHHTGRQHRMDPRLIRLIYQVGRHYDGKRIEVVSGYRHPKVAVRNPKSPHKIGRACDFRVRGVSNAELRDYLRREFKNVGVGYYPNSSFVHLDVRDKRSAFWIDYSGPGENSSYSDDPEGDLRSGRADNARSKIDPSWALDGEAGTPPDLAPR